MKANAAKRQRLRFEELKYDTRPDGRCEVTVRLEWLEKIHAATVEGLETQQGRLRASSAATIDAVLQAAGDSVSLELLGIKAVHAFDGWVVVTSLRAEVKERTYRLLGSASCEEENDLLRAAALSVLDASNRVLERHVRS